MRVAVFGAASARGQRVVQDLLEQRVADEVSRPEVVSPGMDGADVALACFDHRAGVTDPLTAELAALGAAQAAGIPFITACEDRQLVAMLLAEDAAAAPAVVGMSWTPGLSNLLAVAAADGMQRLHAVKVRWFQDPGPPGGIRARGLAGFRRARSFFPEPVGWQRLLAVPGAEIDTLAVSLPGADVSVQGGYPGRLPAPLGGPPTTGWSALRVDVSGRASGAERTVTLGVVDNLAALQSATLVTACLLAGTRGLPGGAKHPVGPEVAFSPSEFFAHLADRGVRVAHLER